MHVEQLSKLISSVMTTLTPSEHDGVLRLPTRSINAKVITEAGRLNRVKVSQFIQDVLDTDPDRLKWISDPHFFHGKIIIFCDRPFATEGEMTNELERRWNDAVKPDDIVLIGGDISFKGKDETNALLKRLNGFKVHVVGNHDVERKSGKLIDFDVDMITDCLSLKYEGRTLLVSHFPIPEHRIPDGCISVHGHTHNFETHGKAINFGAEWTDFHPIPTTQMLAGLSCSFSRKPAKPV